MNKQQAEQKAVETAQLNNRPFKVVPVTYLNGESGWDVSPEERDAANDRAEFMKKVYAALEK